MTNNRTKGGEDPLYHMGGEPRAICTVGGGPSFRGSQLYRYKRGGGGDPPLPLNLGDPNGLDPFSLNGFDLDL